MFIYDKNVWKKSKYAIYLRLICDGLQQTIIVPSIQDHIANDFPETSNLTSDDFSNNKIDSIKWSSYIFISYMIGNFISLIIYGYLRDHYFRSRTLILSGYIFVITGNLLYLLAPNLIFLLLARFLTGITTGVIFQSDIGKQADENLPINKKILVGARFFSFWTLGMILGQQVQGLIFRFFSDFEVTLTMFGDKKIGVNNVGAGLNVILLVISWVVTFVVYRSEYFIEEDYQRKNDIVVEEVEMQLNDEEQIQEFLKKDRPNFTDLFGLTFDEGITIFCKMQATRIIYFLTTTIYGILITGIFQAFPDIFIPTYFTQRFNFDQQKISNLGTLILITRFLGFTFCGYIRKNHSYFACNSIMKSIMIGTAAVLSTSLVMTISNTFSKWYIFAMILTVENFSLPFLITGLMDALTVGICKQQQGVISSVKLCTGSIGWIIGYYLTGQLMGGFGSFDFKWNMANVRVILVFLLAVLFFVANYCPVKTLGGELGINVALLCFEEETLSEMSSLPIDVALKAAYDKKVDEPTVAPSNPENLLPNATASNGQTDSVDGILDRMIKNGAMGRGDDVTEDITSLTNTLIQSFTKLK